MINTRKNDEGCAISPRLRHLKPTARVLLLVHYFPICSCRFTRGEYGCGHQQPAPSTIRLSALRSSPSRSSISPDTSPGLTMLKGFLSRPTRIAGGDLAPPPATARRRHRGRRFEPSSCRARWPSAMPSPTISSATDAIAPGLVRSHGLERPRGTSGRVPETRQANTSVGMQQRVRD